MLIGLEQSRLLSAALRRIIAGCVLYIVVYFSTLIIIIIISYCMVWGKKNIVFPVRCFFSRAVSKGSARRTDPKSTLIILVHTVLRCQNMVYFKAT